jgi:TolB protein
MADPDNRLYNVYLINPDGTDLKSLAEATPGALDPAWCPDSTKIACVSHPAGTPGWIWVLNADGAERATVVTGNLSVAVYPSWTPDGKQITFGAPDSGKQIQLMQVNLDGSGTTVLTHGPKPHRFAAWSPDGQYLAYTTEPGGHSCDLCILRRSVRRTPHGPERRSVSRAAPRRASLVGAKAPLAGGQPVEHQRPR